MRGLGSGASLDAEVVGYVHWWCNAFVFAGYSLRAAVVPQARPNHPQTRALHIRWDASDTSGATSPLRGLREVLLSVISSTMLFALLGVSSCWTPPSDQRARTPSDTCDKSVGGRETVVHIAAIHAHLFYDSSSTLSPDIIGPEPWTLWNTVIGGGDARHRSHSTLVLVDLTGLSSAHDTSLGVQLTVSGPAGSAWEKPLVQVAQVSSTSVPGTAYAPFWLNDTGCLPLTLTASTTGVSPSQSSRVRIDFKCGE